MTRTVVLREVQLTLPMVADMEIAASETAAAVARDLGFSEDKIDEVRLAVVEVCINAFEHSAAEDRKIYLTLSVLGENGRPDRLRVRIRDRGVGFAPEAVGTPRIEEKLTAERKRGWGLSIVRGLMDEVQIRSGADGTELVMTKWAESGEDDDRVDAG